MKLAAALVFTALSLAGIVNASLNLPTLPLSTYSRFIVSQGTKNRVKLACVDWPGHMEVMIPEGLNQQPVENIVDKIWQNGFNCVRLNYAIEMIDDSNSTIGVQDSFNIAASSTGAGALLADQYNATVKNNPWIAGKTRITVFDYVIQQLGKAGVMVILDNHVSKAQWCCGSGDGNGWFGQGYFDVNNWKNGLAFMAKRYQYTPQVVGMSLRNELRDGSDLNTYFSNMEAAASGIHTANPNVLIIFSGLSYDTDLTYFYNRQLPSNYGSKQVYEVHFYSWSFSNWGSGCSNMETDLGDQAGYLLVQNKSYTAPLFFSEWGTNQNPYNTTEQYSTCMIQYLQSNDADFSVWVLAGSYYIRSGQVNSAESFGILSSNWTSVKSPSFISAVSVIQKIHEYPK